MSRDEVVKVVNKTVTKAKNNKDFNLLKELLVDSLTSDADVVVSKMINYNKSKK